jgi:transposase
LEFFAGVDTHRDTHSIAVINQVGELLESFQVGANSSGYAQAIELLAKYTGLVWGLEGTGSYGRPFADALLHAGYIVYEVPGMISKRHRQRLRHPGKSDGQDAHAIAEAVLRDRETLPRHLEADAEEATRLVYERRDRNVREQTIKVNRIRALALRLELELPKDLTTGRALATVMAQLSKHRSRGYADHEVVDEIGDLVTDLRIVIKRIAELERRMRPFVKDLVPGLPRLRGCSTVTAAGLIGHAGLLLNYRSADAFASHAGVAPIPCSSGKHVSVRLHTGGNRQLNRCLHNIANVQMRTEGHAGKIYYDRKRAEGKTHREAMRSLKRRLANVVFRTIRAAQMSRDILQKPTVELAAA